MNELIYYDLKQISGLTGSLASQVSRELGRRIVAGIYIENDLIEDEMNRLALGIVLANGTGQVLDPGPDPGEGARQAGRASGLTRPLASSQS